MNETNPPTVSITAPTGGATIQNGQSVTASASDAESGVKQVEFRYCAGWSCSFASGTTIGSPDTTSPYSVTWNSQPANGTYTIVARATDNAGNTTDSSTVTVVVANSSSSGGVTVGTATHSTVGSGTTLSWSHTVDSASSRVLVVGISTESAYNVACTIASVTYGGVALTKIAELSTGGQSQTLNRDCTSMWYLASPATGTATIAVTATTANDYGIIGGAVELSGVRSTTPDVTNSNSNENGLTSTSITTTNANSLVIDAFGSGHYSGDLSPGPGRPDSSPTAQPPRSRRG